MAAIVEMVLLAGGKDVVVLMPERLSKLECKEDGDRGFVCESMCQMMMGGNLGINKRGVKYIPSGVSQEHAHPRRTERSVSLSARRAKDRPLTVGVREGPRGAHAHNRELRRPKASDLQGLAVFALDSCQSLSRGVDTKIPVCRGSPWWASWLVDDVANDGPGKRRHAL